MLVISFSWLRGKGDSTHFLSESEGGLAIFFSCKKRCSLDDGRCSGADSELRSVPVSRCVLRGVREVKWVTRWTEHGARV